MISRRSVLRHGATATALAGIAVATSQCQPNEAPAAEHPDAELIALGVEFDAAFAAYMPATSLASELADAFFAKHGTWPRKTAPGAEAYFAAYHREVEPAIGLSEAAARATDNLANRIRTLPAKTLAGVAVKARTLRHDLCKWGDNPAPMSDWDWDDLCLERFIREMQTIGGGLV